MDDLIDWWFILLPLIGFIGYIVSYMQIHAAADTLNQKFVSLGTLKGKTFEEIQNVCGSPNSVTSRGNLIVSSGLNLDIILF